MFMHFLWCPRRAASCGEKRCFCLVQFRLLLHVICKLRMISLSYTHTPESLFQVVGAVMWRELHQQLCFLDYASPCCVDEQFHHLPNSSCCSLFFSFFFPVIFFPQRSIFVWKRAAWETYVCLFDSSSPLIFTPAGWDLIGASSAWNTAAVLVFIRRRHHFVAKMCSVVNLHHVLSYWIKALQPVQAMFLSRLLP